MRGRSLSVLTLLAPAAAFQPTFGLRNDIVLKMSNQSNQEIQVVHQPDEEFLNKKGVFDWGQWGCGVSKFPWTYDQSESCYLLAGQVTVTPNDTNLKSATFGKGDFVTFPAGMSCTWDVTEAVQKHYMFF